MRKKDTSKDYLIMSLLRQDARQSLQNISSTISMCRVTVAHRVAYLQKEVIRKYTALVDFQKIGYTTRVLLNITLAPQDKLVFGRYIHGHPALNNLYKTTHGSDYLLELVFTTKIEYAQFMEDIHYAFSIQAFTVSFVEQELVRESFASSVLGGAS